MRCAKIMINWDYELFHNFMEDLANFLSLSPDRIVYAFSRVNGSFWDSFSKECAMQRCVLFNELHLFVNLWDFASVETPQPKKKLAIADFMYFKAFYPNKLCPFLRLSWNFFFWAFQISWTKKWPISYMSVIVSLCDSVTVLCV